MSKSIFAFLSVVLAAATVFTAAVFMGADTEATAITCDRAEGRVVMVIADYLTIDDLSQMEYVRKLAEKSCVGLVSNRQTGKSGADKSKLIIGSGRRLELNTGTEGNNGAESERIPVSDSLRYKEIDRLKRINAASAYLSYIGYIGDQINKNNGTTCLLGNADTALHNRSSMLVAMDSSGIVDAGEADNIYTEDGFFPFIRRTDYGRLAELYKQYLPASSFMVIDTGDMERLEKISASLSEESYLHYKTAILKLIDTFIESLVSYGDFQTLILISTYPSRTALGMNNRLTPILVYDKGEGGILYSRNTRREGIVLNTDIADYVLCKLGYISTSAVTGQKRDEALKTLVKMNNNFIRTSVLRVPVLTSYAVMIMAILVIIFFTIVLPLGKYKKILSWLGCILGYMMLAFPLTLLYLPTAYLGESSAGYTAIAAAASALVSLALNAALKDRIKVAFSICVLVVLGLSADILAGSPFIKQSVLGYDPIIGARFYGIGNEYAGVFIGSSLLVPGCIRELSASKLKRSIALVYSALCILFLGLAFLGANFGGALAGAAGYLLAYFLYYGIQFNKRNIFTGALIWIMIAAVLFAADSLGIAPQSHMGGLVKDAGDNGIGVIVSTITRKISMNLMLMRYTIWTKVLLSIIAIISFMLYKPINILATLFERHRYLKYSWISIAASAAAGFAVNDSGIVVAATAMIYAALTMLIMCISRQENKDGLQNAGKYRT